MKKISKLLIIFIVILISLAGCGHGTCGTCNSTLSDAKEITSYSFVGYDNYSGVIDQQNKTITVTLPYGTSPESLVANFTTTGKSVIANSVLQASGETSNNFNDSMNYTVIAVDGTTQDYMVTVNIAANSAKDITSYSFVGYDNYPGVIDQPNKTITVNLPYGTSITALTAKFTITGESVTVGGVIQTSESSINNFESSVQYTVFAADGSKADYVVTVTIALNTAKEITSYSFAGYDDYPGVIDQANKTITVELPYGASLESLTANFITTGVRVEVDGNPQISGISENTFTSPVDYTVYAADSSWSVYQVTLTISSIPVLYIINTPGQFMWGTIYPYSLNVNTGSLSQINSYPLILTESAPLSIMFNQAGTNAYVPNFYSNTISMYSVNKISGQVMSMGTVSTGSLPQGFVIDPAGKYAYVTNRQPDNNVLSYSIDAATGSLTPLESVIAGNTPYGIVIDPTGKYAYVTNAGENGLSMYSVNAASGQLTPLNPFKISAGVFPEKVVVDPSGRYVYVANTSDTTISMYSINAANGQLTPLNPPTVATTYPVDIKFGPGGKYVYVSNSSLNTISMYSVNAATGQLTPLNPPTVATGSYAYNIAIDPTGKYLYVGTNSSYLNSYTINPNTGILTPLANVYMGFTNSIIAFNNY